MAQTTKGVLQTTRVLLREFTPQDADALALILSDPETMRYYPAPYDRAGVEQWIKRNRQRYRHDGVGLWAMELKKTQDTDVQNEVQKIIGDCGIILQEVEGERLYEIGYHLRRDFWGQGLATEAAIACRDWAFARLKTDRLISLIRPENLPSRRVAERTGMTIWKEVSWRGLPHYVYSIERGRPATAAPWPTTCSQLEICHPERSEGSAVRRKMQIPRFARDDNSRKAPLVRRPD